MKKFLLLLPAVSLGLLTFAQQALKDNKVTRYMQDMPVVMQHNQNANTTAPVNHQHRSGSAGGRLTSILHSERIGSAGNLLSIIEGTCNQIDVNDSLQVVTFIHRNDPSIAPGTNVAQYRYDISHNLGGSFTSDIGPITNSIDIDNVTVNGRFPQAVIYNPAGNSVADSALLVYSGTWHNGDAGQWTGQMRGRGKLSGDTSTFNVHIDPVNSGQVSIAAGMCQSKPGVFWNLNVADNGTFSATSDQIISGLIVEKGVWNPTTKDVDWTETTIPQTFAVNDGGGFQVSIATSWNIAFDPSGKYGWISVLGDLTNDLDSVYDPIFWQSTDSGATWTGPMHVDLDSIQGIPGSLSPTLVDGTTPSSLIPTCAFESKLAVDVNGNPHLLTTVGSGSEYSIEAAGYGVWDITYDAGALAGCNWKGIHLADILTLRGTFSSDNPAQTEDNRPLISRSGDGSKLFFFWEESDASLLGNTNNDIPNLFGRGIDVVANKMTGLRNFTEGDSLWGGETSNTTGGVFTGATFPTVSPVCLNSGNTYNIPLVLTQIDYGNTSGGLGSSVNPAAFWYVNNINYQTSEFTQQLDQVPPTVTLNGADTVTVLVGNSYTELGATAFDCTDGVLNPAIVGTVDTSQINVYTLYYIATDAAGNSDTVTRTVIVGAIPVANFTVSFPQLPYKAVFVDASTNMISNPSWHWTFGDGGGSNAQNPSHVYTTNNTFNVCLTATNSFGSSAPFCQSVTTTGVGIQEPDFAQHISMFPNPSTGKVYLNIEGNSSPDMVVTVYNVLGEEVTAPAKYQSGTVNMQIDMSGALNGVYMVKISSSLGTVVKHLVINHK